MDQRKDVVRRAASIRVDSRSSFVDSLLEALRARLCYDLCKIPGAPYSFASEKERLSRT